MAKRPQTYKHADKLSVDSAACLNFAWLVWQDLKPRMQLALRNSCNGKLSSKCPRGTVDAICDRGITDGTLTAYLTPLGLLVREAGIRTRIES